MIKELENTARIIRRLILRTVHSAQAGHPGGSLSACDITSALFFKFMNIDPSNPLWEDRDRFILSKGHASALLYSLLAHRGYFPEKDLLGFRDINSHLQGHPDMNKTKGVDMSTGSLGMGLSVGCGMAMAGKLSKKSYKTYVLLGDGELNEGQNWEAIMFANKYCLDNLIAIVDRNRLQVDGKTEDIMPLEPLDEKFKSFGWNVIEIDGHDMKQIVDVLEDITTSKPDKIKPTVIIAETIKGKGVSYMENAVDWHGMAPNDEQLDIALQELGGIYDDF